MIFILDLCNGLPDSEKELFKEILNDFLEGLKNIEKISEKRKDQKMV